MRDTVPGLEPVVDILLNTKPDAVEYSVVRIKIPLWKFPHKKGHLGISIHLGRHTPSSASILFKEKKSLETPLAASKRIRTKKVIYFLVIIVDQHIAIRGHDWIDSAGGDAKIDSCFWNN